MNLATLSNGEIIKNPHQFKKLEEKLANAQRDLSKKHKRSHNKNKAKLQVAIIHEKIANTRLDYLHKQANSLLSHYSLIGMEKLNIPDMSSQSHGKNINDASWGIFTNILCYKAEEAGSKIVFVNPKDTTKMCSNCGTKTEKTLWERTHNCPDCGLSIDRDINSARNILIRATAGQVGRNACGDGTKVPSLKQEAHTF
jgi:putative transposase